MITEFPSWDEFARGCLLPVTQVRDSLQLLWLDPKVFSYYHFLSVSWSSHGSSHFNIHTCVPPPQAALISYFQVFQLYLSASAYGLICILSLSHSAAQDF